MAQLRLNKASLAIVYATLDIVSAVPISNTQLLKRHMSSGAKAGLGIGIAVAIIIVVLVIGFFIVHMRRRAHNQAIDRQRAVLAGEKNADGTDKQDKFAPEPEVTNMSNMPRRNKSVKDRLMGPLYRGSMYEMPPVPPRARVAGNESNRQSTASFLDKPWTAGENSPRPSFSSKRATRMMMMM